MQSNMKTLSSSNIQNAAVISWSVCLLADKTMVDGGVAVEGVNGVEKDAEKRGIDKSNACSLSIKTQINQLQTETKEPLSCWRSS